MDRVEWLNKYGDKDRDEWIVGDDDCYPVFVARSRDNSVYHDRVSPCSDGKDALSKSKALMFYDLFAAESQNKSPCEECFEDDEHVEIS
jgi:hypothetical protein